MKKCAIWVLLFGAAFSLFAQNSKNITIYIPPIEGTGSTENDNIVLADILYRELTARNFILGETLEGAEYSLFCKLAPSEENSKENSKEKYFLSLALNDKDGLTLYEQGLHYTTLEEANSYLPSVLLSMMDNIFALQVGAIVEQTKPIVEPPQPVVEPPQPIVESPEPIVEPPQPVVESPQIIVESPEPIVKPTKPIIESDYDDEWRNKLWYLGAGVFWDPRLYYGSMPEINLLNFSFGFSLEFHFFRYANEKLEFLKYLSLGTGMEFASDWIVVSPRLNDDYRNTIMQIPLTLYGVFKPGTDLLLEPYLGILFNIPLLPETTPSLLSWQAGFQYGIKAGQGIFYWDIRYSMDFGKSGINANRPGGDREYDRYMLYLGIGYKYDLIMLGEKIFNNN